MSGPNGSSSALVKTIGINVLYHPLQNWDFSVLTLKVCHWKSLGQTLISYFSSHLTFFLEKHWVAFHSLTCSCPVVTKLWPKYMKKSNGCHLHACTVKTHIWFISLSLSLSLSLFLSPYLLVGLEMTQSSSIQDSAFFLWWLTSKSARNSLWHIQALQFRVHLIQQLALP
jgi:hypothetical protein